MKTNFQVAGIQSDEIQKLLNATIGDVENLHVRKLIVDKKPGYPCRVSLEDANVGEEVLLLTYEHHHVSSPYKSSGPVFIRTAAKQACLKQNEIPVMLHHRLLSLRIYDKNAMMIDARTIEGKELENDIHDVFSNAEARYIHVHNSGPGCYNCQIDRAN